MEFPRSVEISSDEKRRLLSDICSANTILKSYSDTLKVPVESLRDAILGNSDIIPADAIRLIKKTDINIIRNNKDKIHNLLTYYYNTIGNIAIKARIEDDCNEAYIQAFNIAWHYTDIDKNFCTYLYFNVLRKLKIFRYKNKLVPIKSYDLIKLIEGFYRESDRLSNLYRRKATYDEVVESLKWRKSWVKSHTTLLVQNDITAAEQKCMEEKEILIEIKSELFDGLSDIEYDAIMKFLNKEKIVSLRQKYKCTVRALRYALERAKTKVGFAIKGMEHDFAA